ncbi:hypothetical protein AB0I54_47295 [Streptomyces sp. NPDC050625]|uniref:hypothetical protein n=1 Tax=Streptomyces sp. NPDC050625 TaxID=3154629 RepID=UPI003427D4F7
MKTPNTRLQLLCDAAGYSAAGLARAIGDVARDQSTTFAPDPSTVRRWLAGTTPRPPAPALVMECLARRLGRPVTAYEAGLSNTPLSPADPSFDADADPLRLLVRLIETDPDGLTNLGGRAFSIAALTLPTLEGQPRAARSYACSPSRSHRVTQADVFEMQAVASTFHSLAERYGGARLTTALTAYLRQEAVPSLSAPAEAGIHQAMVSTAAQLTLVLAAMYADSAHDGTAQQYHRLAIRLASESNDHAILAIALRAMATHAHQLGHYGPAVLHLAEQATTHARHASPTAQAYAAAELATLQAHHDRRAAIKTLGEAERFHSRAHSTPGPFTEYPAGALHYQRALVQEAFGDHAAAVESLTVSLRLRGPAETRATALTHARRAEVLQKMRRLDEAVHDWRMCLQAAPTLQSARTRRALNTMHCSLRPHRHSPAVAALLKDSIL